MKCLRGTVKALFFTLLAVDAVVFIMIYILGQSISDNYKINRGDTLKLNTQIPVTAVYDGAKMSDAKSRSVGDTFTVDLKMFGIIPFSSANVEVVDEMYVAVLGNPFGMKLYTDGVLVIELSDVETATGKVNPAKKAGIKVGDYIETVNGRKITCNEDLSGIVADSGGKSLEFLIIRSGKKIKYSVNPALSTENGIFRIGLWVRDSSAGIGTLTFYSPSSGVICGLGHGICDDDTGGLLSLNSGEMVEAEILSVDKGTSGSPGELKGKLLYNSIADIKLNSECGVYGTLKGKINISNLTEIALKQEVEDGAAQMLCTVNGSTPKLYSCTIKKRTSTYLSKIQNMVVTITDKSLISSTGGIIQGLSGSPIIQNGKLVGALTHVLVDDPKTGYGIFAENMLETVKMVSDTKVKKAS